MRNRGDTNDVIGYVNEFNDPESPRAVFFVSKEDFT
jgi:hypothetical protein